MSSSSITSCKLLMVVALALSLLPVAHADPAPAVVRIGALAPLVTTSPEEALRQGLAELGYVEGRNLIIDRRRAESNDGLRSAATVKARTLRQRARLHPTCGGVLCRRSRARAWRPGAYELGALAQKRIRYRY
jgi:hypothetical protein